jgi:hypothetical protein
MLACADKPAKKEGTISFLGMGIFVARKQKVVVLSYRGQFLSVLFNIEFHPNATK